MHAHSRRAVLGAGIAAAGSGLLGACSPSVPPNTMGADMDDNGMDTSAKGGDAVAAPRPEYVSPDGPEVRAADRQRGQGPVRRFQLLATATTLDLGARTVKSWAYGDMLPGQEIRVTAGDTLALTLANNLPQPTSLHWHGIRLRNDMDGVPGLTQRPVGTGAAHDYRFTVPDPGTYWIHPHAGVQLDRGLYAPLIVEDPKEPLAYDKEWVIVLDDWLDGVGGSTPDAVLRELNGGMVPGMDHGGPRRIPAPVGSAVSPAPANAARATATATAKGKATAKGGKAKGKKGRTKALHPPSRRLTRGRSALLGGMAGDVAYPYYLANGRTPHSPQVFRAKTGDRVRIRIINAGGDTAFRVALGGHRMTVTHTDGYPVVPAKTDALLVGMGERYDVLVKVKSGVFPFAALAEGKGRSTMAVLRTGGKGARKFPRPKELDGELLTAARLKAAEQVRLSPREPDRTIRMRFTGSPRGYDWSINGKRYDPAQRYPVREGERVRMTFINSTPMWHPFHLHGHTFALPDGGARKDTAILLPHTRVSVDFDADNPGLWMVHCHNVYHSESGMMTVLGYQR
ncbi:multicopper oxidase family protein [Streptomyces sp. NA02950]|uniref:multicopper oxidase family protein n=1 Tax=Streptomyces sp. NA02950 TaxID=2742137 RepID=UPI0015918B8D|nr:multicopper oxidase family protein [Streptomyces sp. NA02950]QKV95320.1 multicopper oxidase family protein [Streptomyces sp. NA02950]